MVVSFGSIMFRNEGQRTPGWVPVKKLSGRRTALSWYLGRIERELVPEGSLCRIDHFSIKCARPFDHACFIALEKTKSKTAAGAHAIPLDTIWSNYFCYGTRRSAFRGVDRYVYERVRGFLARGDKVAGAESNGSPVMLSMGNVGPCGRSRGAILSNGAKLLHTGTPAPGPALG